MTDLRGWRDGPVLGAAALAAAAGFAQFGVTAALGDLAEAFGEESPANGVTAEIGMAGTTMGLGLAIIRLASLGSLPAAGLADRHGRRRVLLGCCAAGLVLTVAAGATPTWWWFVAVFAAGRPLLVATNAVAGVMAAEETGSKDRSAAVALVGGAYAVGTGLVAIARGVAADLLGFRGVFFLAVIPLLALPWLGRLVTEPDRYQASQADADPATRPRFGTVGARWRARLLTVCALHAGVGLVTGPVNGYLFVYGEGVLGRSPAWMSALFVVAGLGGLSGLLLGRWGADRVGRRITAGAALALVALAGLATYSGGAVLLAGGFFLSTFAASVFTPAAGALDAEVFPTSVRSTVAGWVAALQVLGAVVGLLAFGALVDAFGAFGPAAAAVSMPVVGLSLLYRLLPETRGLELEESAPEDPPYPDGQA